MRFVERKARAHAAAQLADTALEARVTPTYRLGCKRVLISDDYYPALKRPNVELVTDRIAEVGPRAIVTADGATVAIVIFQFSPAKRNL